MFVKNKTTTNFNYDRKSMNFDMKKCMNDLKNKNLKKEVIFLLNLFYLKIIIAAIHQIKLIKLMIILICFLVPIKLLMSYKILK